MTPREKILTALLLVAACALVPSLAQSTGSLTIPNTIANEPGPNVNASKLDTNWTTIATYINNREIASGTLGARPVAGTAGRYYFATDVTGGTLYFDNGSAWVQLAPGVSISVGNIDQISGLQLATTSTLNNFTVSAGSTVSDDATVANRVVMTLTATMTKVNNTAWAVGSSNGCLDTGSAAANTWYWVFLIQRTDTAVVDVLCSLSYGNPSLPANYTKKRPLMAFKTWNEANTIIGFVQDGDCAYWYDPILEVNTTNPGTSAVTVTLGATPPGIETTALLNGYTLNTTTNHMVYVSPLLATDLAPSESATPLGQFGTGNGAGAMAAATSLRVLTDDSQRFRYRLSASGAADVIRFVTTGFCYRRALR